MTWPPHGALSWPATSRLTSWSMCSHRQSNSTKNTFIHILEFRSLQYSYAHVYIFGRSDLPFRITKKRTSQLKFILFHFQFIVIVIECWHFVDNTKSRSSVTTDNCSWWWHQNIKRTRHQKHFFVCKSVIRTIVFP